MSIWTRFRDLVTGRSSAGHALPPRRERREAARHRHKETGEPAWTADDQHLGADGERVVVDVAPGTPGHFGSVRTTRDH